MSAKCYKAGGPHYGRPNWDEFCWIDPFVCTGCGVDFSVTMGGEKLHDKMCGRRYGNLVLVAFVCGCEYTRFNLVLLDEADCIAAHYSMGEADLRQGWPEIAEFYIDNDPLYDEDDYDPVTEEREFWPEWYRKYSRMLAERGEVQS